MLNKTKTKTQTPASKPASEMQAPKINIWQLWLSDIVTTEAD